MSSRVRKLLLIVGGTLLFCCLCMVIIIMFVPVDEEALAIRRTTIAIARTTTAEYTPPSSTPHPTNSPIPTTITGTRPNTPQPTKTDSPTNTPIPSATPTITNTPEPSDAPIPSPDPTEVAYVESILTISADYQLALQRISSLSTQAGEDPSLFLDENWKLDMIIALAILLVEEEALQELTPPAKYVEVHEIVLEAAAHYSEAARLMEQGINNLDTASISQASAEMIMGGEKTREATELLEEIEASE